MAQFELPVYRVVPGSPRTPFSCKMRVEGHVFVVTGGASGLGEATIRAVCNKGGKGVIFDIPKQAERANAIVQELGADNCVFIPCDVTNEDSIVKAIEAAGSKWGKIHGNINCVS